MTKSITVEEWLEHVMGGFTEERLREVFNLVQNTENWKNPIVASVPYALASKEEIEKAVVFFAGGVPEITTYYENNQPVWYVRGAGYYEWIGA